MHKKIFYHLTAMAFVSGMLTAEAQSATVATVPTGMISCPVMHGTTSYLSLPLTNEAVYTTSVTAVTANTVSVGDSPAPFTSNLATAAAPYLVEFLTGSEMGRVLLITSNTASTLTLNITDNSTQTVNLTTTGFSVAVGDTFEIIPAQTLATIFGDNSSQNPLVLNGSTTVFKADSVSLYSMSMARWISYYYNTTNGQWQCYNAATNANNTILYPYSALTVTRRSTSGDLSFVMKGSVAEVASITKTAGNSIPVYASTGYAADMKLSQINLGSTWVTGSTAFTADTISIWNNTLSHFDTYYQTANSTWRKSVDATTDVSNLVVPAGTAICILQRSSVNGATSFLSSTMPYSLN